MGELDWVEKYVDIKGLAEEVIRESERVKVQGITIDSKGLLVIVALDEIRVRILSAIADMEYREAKLKLEKAKAERALKEAEKREGS